VSTEAEAALERALNGPAPYGSGNPIPVHLPAVEALPVHSAARELAGVLGRPALAKRVAELCGNNVAAVLAEAVTAAIKRRTAAMDLEIAVQLDAAHAAIRARWNEPAPDCGTPDVADFQEPLDTWAARVDIAHTIATTAAFHAEYVVPADV
jgi:hypothetical protein